ncbi:TRAP transporter large permease [Fodinicurvata sediminis]|uniref:TRAP transporter large permease n=1 Tax=Fodinicurvata sediminis TaxID=1121832 RepID=UPI0003FC3C9E|nr:TRAP transporter large permease subunit [Fodinicurvata sediminis]
MGAEALTLFMFGGLLLGLFLGHPLAFVLGGVAVLAAFMGPGSQVFGLIISRIYGGVMDSYILVAVPLFILMARFLSSSGVTDRMFETLRQLMGGLRGGLTLSVIIISVLLAATTGIIGASITVMGMLALRPMLENGYRKDICCGAIAAGGSLGVLIPPSIMLIIMASYAPVSVGELFAGALIPGLVLAVLYGTYVLGASYLFPSLGPPLTAEQRALIEPRKLLLDLLKDVVPPLVLILGVLGSIFGGIATATEAAAIGAFLAFCFMIIYGSFDRADFFACLRDTGKVTSMVLFVVVGATAFTGVFTAGGGLDVVREMLLGNELPVWAIIVVMLVIMFVLGMFLDWIGIVLLSFPIFLPILEQMNVDILWFVVLSAVVLQTSFLTPPFGYALFYLKGVASDDIAIGDIYRGVVPFVVLIIIGAGLVAAFPGLILWLPNMMTQ